MSELSDPQNQRARVLQAFLVAPGHALKSADIDAIPYCNNQRARMSELRKCGHRWSIKHIKGTTQYLHTYLGQETVEEAKRPAARRRGGHWIGPKDGLQIWAPAEEARP